MNGVKKTSELNARLKAMKYTPSRNGQGPQCVSFCWNDRYCGEILRGNAGLLQRGRRHQLINPEMTNSKIASADKSDIQGPMRIMRPEWRSSNNCCKEMPSP